MDLYSTRTAVAHAGRKSLALATRTAVAHAGRKSLALATRTAVAHTGRRDLHSLSISHKDGMARSLHSP